MNKIFFMYKYISENLMPKKYGDPCDVVVNAGNSVYG
jgi:hypothetical protein